MAFPTANSNAPKRPATKTPPPAVKPGTSKVTAPVEDPYETLLAAEREKQTSQQQAEEERDRRKATRWLPPGTHYMRIYAEKREGHPILVSRDVAIHELYRLNPKGVTQENRLGVYLCEGPGCRICDMIRACGADGWWQINTNHKMLIIAVVYSSEPSNDPETQKALAKFPYKKPVILELKPGQGKAFRAFITSLKRPQLEEVLESKEHFMLKFVTQPGKGATHTISYSPDLVRAGRPKRPEGFPSLATALVGPDDRISPEHLKIARQHIIRSVNSGSQLYEPTGNAGETE